MKTLSITEDQMTFVLKEFLKQYTGSFDHASFDYAGTGYAVHFHQSPDIPPMQEERSSTHPAGEYPLPSYTPPISITMPDFGGFGGFGGGSSGGAGATGQW